MIWKYELEITDRQVIKMPCDRSILSVGDQRGKLVLWVDVNRTAPDSDCWITIYGTGNPRPVEPDRFIGTVEMSRLVWHVFEVLPIPGHRDEYVHFLRDPRNE